MLDALPLHAVPLDAVGFHGLGAVFLIVWILGLRHRSKVLLALGAACGALAMLWVLSHGSFFAMRLAGHAVFGYLPVALALAAWLGGRWRWTLSALATGVVLVGIWAYGIEPRWLEIGRYRVESPEITAPVRIAVVADLQTDRIGDYERRVLDALMAEQPDLMLFPGDYLQVEAARWPQMALELNRELRARRLHAPLGVFATGGDVEPRSWPQIFDGLPVTTGAGTHRVTPEVVITALSAVDSRFGARLPAVDGLHIVFGHAPDFALDDIAGADLLIAGHTHGGQVRLPGLGPLVKLSRVPRGWAAGHTRLTDGGHLFVSRGLGMERGRAPRLRFLCRPELMVIEVVPASHSMP